MKHAEKSKLEKNTIKTYIEEGKATGWDIC